MLAIAFNNACTEIFLMMCTRGVKTSAIENERNENLSNVLETVLSKQTFAEENIRHWRKKVKINRTLRDKNIHLMTYLI